MPQSKKTSQPLVTIGIVCYNYQDYVSEAIRSVRDQIYKNIEIIVINNGSTDNSDAIIKKLHKTIDFEYISQGNEGVVPARNLIIEKAKGEYLIQLDADDTLPDNYVQTLVAAIDGSDIYYTEAVDPANGNIIVHGVDFDLEKLKLKNYIHAASMYKLATLRRFRYDELLNNKALEDWDLNIGMGLAGAKGVFVPGVHLNYRQHEKSRSSDGRRTLKNFEAIDYILAKHTKQSPDAMGNMSWISLNISRLIAELHTKIDKVSSLETEVYDERQRTKETIAQLNLSKEDARRAKAAYNAVVGSKSYKVGKLVFAPVRVLKKAAKKTKHKLALQKTERRLQALLQDTYNISDGHDLNVDVVVRSYYHPTSSTFIRLLSPLTSGPLKGKLNIRLVDGEATFSLRKNADIVIVQRTAMPSVDRAEKLVDDVRQRNALLFVDTDDAFNNLDPNHPQYNEQSMRTKALDYVIEHANDVWFSTKKLQASYDAASSRVVTNTLDTRLWKRVTTANVTGVTNLNTPLQILYMGTATHQGDFEMIFPALEKLYDTYPGEFILTIIGVAQGIDELPWIRIAKPTSGLYPNFVAWMSDEGPFDIGISPLEDSEFNRGKSDIKCLDYLGIGAEPVVSNVEAYKNRALTPLITRVNNTSDDWFVALEKKIKNRHKNRQVRDKKIQAGYDYITDHRSSDVAAQTILESIQEQGKL